MKWLLIVFVNSQLVGTIETGSEAACLRAKQLIETEIVIPTPGLTVRMSCLPDAQMRSERS